MAAAISQARARSAPSASTRARAWRLICELLGGSLTGTGATRPDRRFANGMFSLYVDPARIDPAEFFDADVQRFVDWVRSAKPVPGQTVLTPGEPEQRARKERMANGLPMTEQTWAAIVASARKVGVEKTPTILEFALSDGAQSQLALAARDPGANCRPLGEIEAALVGEARVRQKRNVGDAEFFADQKVAARHAELETVEREVAALEDFRLELGGGLFQVDERKRATAT